MDAPPGEEPGKAGVGGRLPGHVVTLAREHPWATGLLATATAVSVFLLLRGQGADPPRLGLVFRRFHLGWEILAAVLWPLLIVRRGTGFGDTVAHVLGGWVHLLATMAAGVLLGILAGALSVGPPLPGDPTVPLAMALTLTTVYLLVSALTITSRHPWRWLLGLYLVPVIWVPLIRPLDWGPLVAIRRWVAVGELGPGTALEVPAMVGGLVLEPEWEGIDPWRTALFWFAVALVSVTVAAWVRGGTSGPGGPAKGA